MSQYVQPFDVNPVTELSAVGSGQTGTPFPVNVGGSVTTWLRGATGTINTNTNLRGQFARYRTTASDTVVLETADDATYADTWQTEETLVAPGGGPMTVKRQRFLAAA